MKGVKEKLLLNENGAPASTSPIPEHENEWFYNSFRTLPSVNSWTNCDNTPSQIQQNYDNECYTYPEDSRDPCYTTICDGDIPLLTNAILSQNYTDVNTLQQSYLQHQLQQLQQQLPQQLQLQPQQLQQQLQQQLSPPSPFYFNEYLIDGGDSGIDREFYALLALENN